MTDEKLSDSELLESAFVYITQLQTLNSKNTQIILELISSLGESNSKLREALDKITFSKSSKLWTRYFKELDSGNPRECVLNSLVELIKLEKQYERE